VSRKGKAGPLEAGKGKYSPPANPERVTSEGLKRRDKGVHLLKILLIKARKLQSKLGIPGKQEKRTLSERGFG